MRDKGVVRGTKKMKPKPKRKKFREIRWIHFYNEEIYSGCRGHRTLNEANNIGMDTNDIRRCEIREL